ncbi:single-stranded DNA-binding protein [uncultured Lactobacillus sp.]|uniref:single-stranded DNA-binding protein n=1 Tax=uncultured Lactobacillus sp. TaxID=153152 RepID=UPI00261D7536|nr:single-stranded DNA-binding protein [uncultured Lactobacillus sp.]
MSQIVCLTGQIAKKGKLYKSEKGILYLRIILHESSGRSVNKFPIVFYRDTAKTVAQNFAKDDFVLVEGHIVSSENKKYDRTFYNLSIFGKEIVKISEFNDQKGVAKSAPTKQVDASDVRDTIKNKIEEQSSKEPNVAKPRPENSVPTENLGDKVKKSKNRQMPDADSQMAEGTSDKSDNSGFDESLFDLPDDDF